jgi:hypothetical protein
LIDAIGNKSKTVPLRLADIISAWFEHDPINAKKFRLELSYEEIAKLYEEGKIKKKMSNSAPENVAFKKSLRPAPRPSDYLAKRFSSDFTRWLFNNHLIPGDKLFENDRLARTYKVIRSGWHDSTPLKNRSETRNTRLFKQSDAT